MPISPEMNPLAAKIFMVRLLDPQLSPVPSFSHSRSGLAKGCFLEATSDGPNSSSFVLRVKESTSSPQASRLCGFSEVASVPITDS